MSWVLGFKFSIVPSTQTNRTLLKRTFVTRNWWDRFTRVHNLDNLLSSDQQLSLSIRNDCDIMIAVLRPVGAFCKFQFVVHQKLRKDDLQLMRHKEPSGTGVEAGAEIGGVFGHGGEVKLGWVSSLAHTIESPRVEGFWIGVPKVLFLAEDIVKHVDTTHVSGSMVNSWVGNISKVFAGR
jgi:hypothetical protein